MKTYKSMFGIGDPVRLKHDKEKRVRMVTQVTFAPTGCRYNLSCGAEETWHYEIECEGASTEETRPKAGFLSNSVIE